MKTLHECELDEHTQIKKVKRESFLASRKKEESKVNSLVQLAPGLGSESEGLRPTVSPLQHPYSPLPSSDAEETGRKILSKS